jgi:hypothetical protein
VVTEADIVAACKAIIPNPEHGPEQYQVVIDYLNAEGDYGDLCDLSLEDAVEVVMSFMNLPTE